MTLDYKITRSDKRKTLSLKISPDGKLEVLAPCDLDDVKIQNIVDKKSFWIYKTTKRINDSEIAKQKEFISGELFWYLGRKYRLDVTGSDERGLVFKKNKFVLHTEDRDKAKTLFAKWYRLKAKEKLINRVEKYAKQMGVKCGSIKILDMQKRWGSCTKDGNIILNWHLVKAPLHAIDYVIVNELAHLIEHNHSDRFWSIIKTQTPDYLASKQWLTNSNLLII